MNSVYLYLLSGFLASLVLYVLIQSLPNQFLGNPQQLLEEAGQFYQLGETATTVSERKEAFNSALSRYLDLEKKYKPHYGNGKLYYNIANSYYQLDELPLAIYYYYQAFKLAPRDVQTQHNLSQALQKLHLNQMPPELLSGQTLTLGTILSLPQRLCLFFWTVVVFFLLASLSIWRPFSWLKLALALVGIVALFLLGTLVYNRFISVQEGVLVQASSLYRDAGTQYAKASNEPLPAGLKVEVVSIRNDGSWIKILSPDGALGYVSSEAIKLL